MNSTLFKAYLIQHNETQQSFAEKLGLSLSRLNAKINNTAGADFSQSEIFAIQQLWQLTAQEIQLIFFTNKLT